MGRRSLFAGAENLINIAILFNITHLLAFLNDKGFNMKNQDKYPAVPKSPFQMKYDRLKPRDRKIVDLVLFDI